LLNSQKCLDPEGYCAENEEENLQQQMSLNMVKRQLFLANLAKSFLLRTEKEEEGIVVQINKLENDHKMKLNLSIILSIFYQPPALLSYLAVITIGRKQKMAEELFEKFKLEFLHPWKIVLEQQEIGKFEE
jgi:hypothetical protein